MKTMLKSNIINEGAVILIGRCKGVFQVNGHVVKSALLFISLGLIIQKIDINTTENIR